MNVRLIICSGCTYLQLFQNPRLYLRKPMVILFSWRKLEDINMSLTFETRYLDGPNGVPYARRLAIHLDNFYSKRFSADGVPYAKLSLIMALLELRLWITYATSMEYIISGSLRIIPKPLESWNVSIEQSGNLLSKRAKDK